MNLSLQTEIFSLFNSRWALLTSGGQHGYNCMTISWGSLGSIWGPRNAAKDIATVYVHPSRYTREFLDRNNYFTISFFPESHKRTLALLGSESGRDGDKLAKTALTVQASDRWVTYKEAELTLVCRKIYWQDMQKANIPDNVNENFYSGKEPHRMYMGEVLEIIRPEVIPQ